MDSKKLTVSAIFVNIFLFIIKIIAGIKSGSLAVISDAFNSFTDILSSIFIHFSVKLSMVKADSDHPFGHDRAEPLAAFISAVFASILGFELLKNAVFSESKVLFGFWFAILVLIFTIIVKSVMAYYFSKEKTPAMKAAAVDSKNDVMVSIIALLGIISSFFGIYYMDRVSAVIISLFIFYTAYRIGVENIDYLMGKAASSEVISRIRRNILEIKGIKGINELRAHYVGSRIQVEIHVEVNKKIDTKKSHDLGKVVQRKIESMPEISRAFIHIDPV